MENGSSGWVISFILGMILLVSLSYKDMYEDRTAEAWFDEYSSMLVKNEELENALEEANSNIEEAKYYTWESYDEMGWALENLETVYEP